MTKETKPETPSKEAREPVQSVQPSEVAEVKCSVELFNKLVNVLQQLPYNQISGLMDEVKTGFQVASTK